MGRERREKVEEFFPGRRQSQSISTFTFIKRLLSSSSLSAIRVVSSAYLRLLILKMRVNHRIK